MGSGCRWGWRIGFRRIGVRNQGSEAPRHCIKRGCSAKEDGPLIPYGSSRRAQVRTGEELCDREIFVQLGPMQRTPARADFILAALFG